MKLVRRAMMLAVFLTLSILIAIGGLNYSGFCFDQKRYLSDQEKNQIAVSDTLYHYPPTLRIRKLSVVEGAEQSATDFFRPADPIKYRNEEEI